MKKAFILVLILMIVVALSACGGAEVPSPDTPPELESPAAPESIEESPGEEPLDKPQTELDNPTGESSDKPTSEPAEQSVFENINGVFTTVDLENSPFDNSGLKIEINRGTEGYIKFTIVGTDGSETLDYFIRQYGVSIYDAYANENFGS